MTQRTVTVCDKCGNEIVNGTYIIDGQTYGFHLHRDCFLRMSALEFVARVASLDDVYYHVIDNKTMEAVNCRFTELERQSQILQKYCYDPMCAMGTSHLRSECGKS